MGEDQLDAYASAADERLLPSTFIWHRVKLHRVCAPQEVGCVTGTVVDRDSWYTMDYGAGTQPRKYGWDYGDDYAFWTVPGAEKIPLPSSTDACFNTGVFGNGTCLKGRLWTHSDSLVGSDANHACAGTSCEIQVGVHDIQLSNHFFQGDPDKTFFWTTGGMQTRPFFDLRFTLPDPAPDGWEFSRGTVLPIVNEDGRLNAVFDDGHRADATTILSPAAQDLLLDPGLSWSSAVEPSPFAGNATRPLVVALESDGSSMAALRALVDSGSGLVERGAGPETGSGPDGSPPARTAFAAAYSRARGRLFLGGGTDASGTPLNDVWKMDFARGYWELVPRVRDALWPVAAMTFSYRDGMLWILDRDQRSDGSWTTTRLFHVDPTTGSWEIVHESQPNSLHDYDTLTLAVDADGNLVISASNTYPQRHRFAVVAPRAGGYDVSLTSCRQRALATGTGALADPRGFVLHFAEDSEVDSTCTDDPQPILGGPTERLATLPLRSATVTDLEELLR